MAKRTATADRLAMTPAERERIGLMFRIQLPIVDRATLKDHAELLERLALQMKVCASQWQERDFKLMSILKYEVALVNNRARESRYRSAEQSGPPEPTQN